MDVKRNKMEEGVDLLISCALIENIWGHKLVFIHSISNVGVRCWGSWGPRIQFSQSDIGRVCETYRTNECGTAINDHGARATSRMFL